jgi:hypothetical protein
MVEDLKELWYNDVVQVEDEHMREYFQSMKDQFNGNTEKRRPRPHLTGHEVYEMVKDVRVVLGKRKRTGKNTEEDDV